MERDPFVPLSHLLSEYFLLARCSPSSDCADWNRVISSWSIHVKVSAVALGYPVSWAFHSLLATIYFFWGDWRKALKDRESVNLVKCD